MLFPFALPQAPNHQPGPDATALVAQGSACTHPAAIERIISSSWSGASHAAGVRAREPAAHSALWHACRGIWRPPMR